ncbi:MAG: hypothetical protein VKJ04_06845 [Vampirovibrionales bacterium]|nr:hypothetical protein [Vampirovibrionales bacterium]
MSDGVSLGGDGGHWQPMKGLPPVVPDNKGRPPWDPARLMEAPKKDDFYLTGKATDFSADSSHGVHEKTGLQKIGDWFKKAWHFILNGPNAHYDENNKH